MIDSRINGKSGEVQGETEQNSQNFNQDIQAAINLLRAHETPSRSSSTNRTFAVSTVLEALEAAQQQSDDLRLRSVSDALAKELGIPASFADRTQPDEYPDLEEIISQLAPVLGIEDNVADQVKASLTKTSRRAQLLAKTNLELGLSPDSTPEETLKAKQLSGEREELGEKLKEIFLTPDLEANENCLERIVDSLTTDQSILDDEKRYMELGVGEKLSILFKPEFKHNFKPLRTPTTTPVELEDTYCPVLKEIISKALEQNIAISLISEPVDDSVGFRTIGNTAVFGSLCTSIGLGITSTIFIASAVSHGLPQLSADVAGVAAVAIAAAAFIPLAFGIGCVATPLVTKAFQIIGWDNPDKSYRTHLIFDYKDSI